MPTEIFPSHLRAQGNGFGITGWAIGVGMTTLVNPVMFQAMTVNLAIIAAVHDADHYSQSRTYFLFAGLNLIWIPIIYLCTFLLRQGMLKNQS